MQLPVLEFVQRVYMRSLMRQRARCVHPRLQSASGPPTVALAPLTRGNKYSGTATAVEIRKQKQKSRFSGGLKEANSLKSEKDSSPNWHIRNEALLNAL